MTKVIKLALCALAGIEPDEKLLSAFPDFQQEQDLAQDETKPIEQETPTDALATVIQELSALREEIAQQRTEPSAQSERPPDTRSRRQQPMPPTLPEENWPADAHREPAPVASSGLNMSGPRRRRDRPPDTPHRHQPVEAAFDADEARRKLVASINAYGKGLREGC
jgi:hypothetical protein